MQSRIIKPQYVVIATLAIILFGLVALFITLTDSNRATAPVTPEAPAGSTAVPLIAENSYVLEEAPNAKVVVTEFLDFECEYCAALYPYMEQAREKYRGEATFVVRNFLIPSHTNTMTSALAVEAAARQGKFEEMYRMMFERQGEWGEQKTDQSAVFRGYAAELDLDLAAYDQALTDPAASKRIEEDWAAGQALGVQGTPSVFVNDEKIDIQSYADLDSAISSALAAN